MNILSKCVKLNVGYLLSVFLFFFNDMIAEDLKELKFQWRYVWTNSQDTEDKQHKSLRCFILPPSF